MKKTLIPTRIVYAEKVQMQTNLLKRKDLQIGLEEDSLTEFQEGSSIILDYGREHCGGIRILTFHAKSVRVRIRFGESVTECCSELNGEQNATNDCSNRDFEVFLQDYSNMRFGETGFRFVRLDFYGAVKIKSILAESHIYQRKAVFQYTGDDELIAQIFSTAKRTIDLCASNGYVWDGVKRDRLVWIGDMHPEMLALTTLYGRVLEVEKSLDFIKNQTPLPKWMNKWFPTYSMWWVIIIADYYQYTKAKDFTKRQLPYLQGLLDLMLDCVLENGEMNYPSYFIDWQMNGKPEEKMGARALNIMAAKRAKWLLEEFAMPSNKAELLLERLKKVEIVAKNSKQVIALKYFATGLTEEDKKNLVKNGAKGMSTFMSYYILKAVASFDKVRALEMMKEYYGGMLSKGATTFWEDFDLSWIKNSCRIDEFPQNGQKDIHGDFGAYCYKGFRHSLCHGWSTGVLQFIKEECE